MDEIKTETKTEEPKTDNVLRLMDQAQIAMICSDSPKVKAYLELDLLDKQVFAETKSTVKEPASNERDPEGNRLRFESTYPLSYLMTFMTLAKRMKATHVAILIGENKPARLEFDTEDGKTWYYIAPKIKDD